MKDCGSCQHFIKLRNSKFRFSAICGLKDYNTASDCGHDCKYWKAIPYDRRRRQEADMGSYGASSLRSSSGGWGGPIYWIGG